MPKKTTAVKEETPSTPVLTNTELLRAATNDPALSKTKFTLGDKTFTIMDFKYDDYMKFINYLSPLLDTFIRGMTNGALGLDGFAGASFTVQQIFQYCADELPQMALLVARQSDPEVTVDQLKELAGTPFNLAKLCLAQINHNKIIEAFGDFFVQMTQTLKGSLSTK